MRSTCQHSRGYARPGETPELIVPGSRFSVNMISTITNQGKVRWMIYTGKMNAALFIVFLTRLIAGATKKVFLIVDHFVPLQWRQGHNDLAGFVFGVVGPMYAILLIYSLLYMPTMALTNALAFRQMKDPSQDFGSIRVLGTAGWIVAGLHVFLRDTGQVITVLLTLWFWMTPIFISDQQFPVWARFLLRVNPLSYLVRAYRVVLLGGRFPDPWDFAVATAYGIAAFVIGGLFFRMAKRGFADVL